MDINYENVEKAMRTYMRDSHYSARWMLILIPITLR